MTQQLHSWVYIQRKWTLIWKDTHPNVHSTIIYNSQDTEATQVSMDRWTDKDVVHIYNGKLLSHKKEWNFATTWLDLESSMLSGISQTEKDKYYILSLICGI